MSEQTESYIDLYLSGKLSEEEKKAFEERIEQEPELDEQVRHQKALIEGIMLHHRKRLKQMFEEEESQYSSDASTTLDSEPTIRRLSPLQWSLAVAAGLALLLLIYFQMGNSATDHQKVYQQFAQHYDSGLGERNAQDSCDLNMEGVQFYNMKEYESAIPALKRILTQEQALTRCGISPEDIQRLVGISELFANQVDNALLSLKPQIAQSETSRWYYILGLLKQGRSKEVQQALQNWSSPSAYYQTKIQALQQAL
ncbi:MAG: hypothetical protein AAF587_17385 [Bacteroidota bacterium]